MTRELTTVVPGPPMTKDEVRAVVERFLVPAAEVLGVAHWQLRVAYGPCATHTGARAEVHRSVDYQWAYITIDPAEFHDEREVVDALHHELIHVVLYPFDLYREVMLKGLKPGSARARQEARLWTHAVERAVANVELVLVRATFFNPYCRENGREYQMASSGEKSGGKKAAAAAPKKAAAAGAPKKAAAAKPAAAPKKSGGAKAKAKARARPG